MMKSFVLSVIVIALFHVNVYSQLFGIESEWIDATPQNLEYILTDQGRAEVTLIDSLIVDAVQNAAIILPGTFCGAEMVSFKNVPEGTYAVAISEGELSIGGANTTGCYVLLDTPHELYGLHGFGSPRDPRSYVLFTVGVGQERSINFFIVGSYCGDHSGWVKVRLYEVTN